MADVTEIGTATGEVTERAFTSVELAQREAVALALTQAALAAEADATQRAAIRDSAITRFKGFGFTEAEIATLVLQS